MYVATGRRRDTKTRARYRGPFRKFDRSNANTFPNDRCDVSTRRFLFSRIKRAGFVGRPWINREFSFFFLSSFLSFFSSILSYIVLYRDSRDHSTLRTVCYVSTRYLRGDLRGCISKRKFRLVGFGRRREGLAGSVATFSIKR